MAVRLFVGNMPYGATEADLRAHFAGVGEPSQIVIPVDRETGRPRGFAFVEFLDRAVAEEAINRFNQQPFMGRSLSVSEARPREERARWRIPAERRRLRGGGFGSDRGGGGFGGPRPMAAAPAASVRAALRATCLAHPDATSVRPRRRARRARSAGKTRNAARRARSRSATPVAWAGSTTTRTTSPEPIPDFDDPASRAADEDKDEK